jgi:hypothetical protein
LATVQAKVLLSVFAAIAALAAGGCSSHAVRSSETTTSRTIAANPWGRGGDKTLVVRRGAILWRAHVTLSESRNARVEIDRWNRKRWLRDGITTIPTRFGPVDYLHAASLTHSGAPDFVMSIGDGADWTPFTVVSRLRGNWRPVAFDYPPSGNEVIIDAYRIYRGSVEAWVGPCGCAAGPYTSTWYRFDGTGFVPTTPPAAGSACTAQALDAARPLEGLEEFVGPPTRLAAPYRVRRFACLDGWALATDSAGRFALFNLQGGLVTRGKPGPHVWYRASVGALRRVEADRHSFALTRTLLKQLEHDLAPR